jgi:hypothetical protein
VPQTAPRWDCPFRGHFPRRANLIRGELAAVCCRTSRWARTLDALTLRVGGHQDQNLPSDGHEADAIAIAIAIAESDRSRCPASGRSAPIADLARSRLARPVLQHARRWARSACVRGSRANGPPFGRRTRSSRSRTAPLAAGGMITACRFAGRHLRHACLAAEAPVDGRCATTMSMLGLVGWVWARDGGGPARRAVIRWELRLFRREWRQRPVIPSGSSAQLRGMLVLN